MIFTTIKRLFAGRSTRRRRGRERADQKEGSVQIPVQPGKSSSSWLLHQRTAPEGQEFHLHHGPSVATIGELADALADADDEVFFHHTEGERNDFACWVRDVFDESGAAAVIASADSRKRLVYILDLLNH